MTRFTEVLLIGAVMSVFGLMSGFAVLSARSHARDVTRLANVREIQMSLELFFQQQSSYPISADAIPLGQALTACLSSEGFSGPCPTSGPTPYLTRVTTPPTAGIDGRVSCGGVSDVYCYRGGEESFRIEFELESGNAVLGVAKGVNCVTENGFIAGACPALSL